MNRLVFTILTLLCLMNCSVSGAQSEFISKLKNYRDSTKNELVQLFKANPALLQYVKLLEIGRYTFIPFCSFDGMRLFRMKNDIELLKIRRDTSNFSYRITSKGNELQIEPTYLWEGRLYSLYLGHGTSFSQSVYRSLFDTARKYSDYCFALKIKDGDDPVAYFTMGYLEKDSLRIIGFDGWKEPGRIISTKYKNIRDYIVSKYGSEGSFVKLCIHDSLANEVRSMSIRQCKRELAKSYIFFEDYHAKDTAKILDLFVSEIYSMPGITQYKIDSFRSLLISALHSISQHQNNGTGFMGLDYYIVKDILDERHINIVKDRLEFLGDYERLLVDKIRDFYGVKFNQVLKSIK